MKLFRDELGMAIEKGNVELQSGAITPVTRGLWHAAGEKLSEATAGMMKMEGAKDRIEYEAGWTCLVDSLEEFWTRFFDEGKRKFPSFQPWAGAIDAKRKKDPLLAYLYQARHQSQHGCIALEWEAGQIHVGGGEFSGNIKGMQIFADGTFEVDVTPTHGSDAKFKVVHDPGNARLPIVLNKKHKESFGPPSTHLNNPIADVSPISVGWLGIEFYDDILRQAFAKFGNVP